MPNADGHLHRRQGPAGLGAPLPRWGGRRSRFLCLRLCQGDAGHLRRHVRSPRALRGARRGGARGPVCVNKRSVRLGTPNRSGARVRCKIIR